MTRLATIAAFVLLLARPATAAPYWISYEANDYPENEGWERRFADENGSGQGGAERSLDNGVLTLNSMRNHLIRDSYRMSRQVNPDPGELFIAEWRVRVIESVGPLPDQWFGVATDDGGTLALGFTTTGIYSDREEWTLPLSLLDFRSFRLESRDMRGYSLYIDGVHAIDGVWDIPTLNMSYVQFGDSVSGGMIRSHAQWDYVRFGVVPEPGAVWLLATGCIFFLRRDLRWHGNW